MLMTAHVVFAALDPTRPATLSRQVVTDLLRDPARLSRRDRQRRSRHARDRGPHRRRRRRGRRDPRRLRRAAALPRRAHQLAAEAALLREAERDAALRGADRRGRRARPRDEARARREPARAGPRRRATSSAGRSTAGSPSASRAAEAAGARARAWCSRGDARRRARDPPRIRSRRRAPGLRCFAASSRVRRRWCTHDRRAPRPVRASRASPLGTPAPRSALRGGRARWGAARWRGMMMPSCRRQPRASRRCLISCIINSAEEMSPACSKTSSFR